MSGNQSEMEMMRSLGKFGVSLGALMCLFAGSNWLMACNTGSDRADRSLTAGQERIRNVERALLDLPYRVRLDTSQKVPGTQGMVRGVAVDPKRGWRSSFTFIFGRISGTDLAEYSNAPEQAVFDRNLNLQSVVEEPLGAGRGQFYEAAGFVVDIQDAACEALSGEPCSI
jgi:hypothetical protein